MQPEFGCREMMAGLADMSLNLSSHLTAKLAQIKAVDLRRDEERHRSDAGTGLISF
jgi:hypothetical protein